jgi:hypothetical protein
MFLSCFFLPKDGLEMTTMTSVIFRLCDFQEKRKKERRKKERDGSVSVFHS